MKIHEVSQGTLDWLQMHIGIPTASALDSLLTPTFDFRTGEMPKTFLYRKVAEVWRGQPLVELNNFSCEQGLVLEEEARPFFELETEQAVRQVGFITTDDGLCGCSPDGLIGDDNGLEIKSPAAHTHVKYLLHGTLPKEYAAQVHGSMFVTGYPRWTFMSYRRKFPPLIVEVKRDEEIISKIAEAVRIFHANMADAKAKIATYTPMERAA